MASTSTMNPLNNAVEDIESASAVAVEQNTAADDTKISKKLAIALFAGAMVAGAAIGTAAGGSSAASDANGATESSSSSSTSLSFLGDNGETTSISNMDRASSSGGFCMVCDNAPSRGWSWWFGWGECECHDGWEGACCDVPTDLSLRTYGPYHGNPGTYEQYTIGTEDIAENMYYPDCDGNNVDGTSVPPQFGGLWWMDGNPASDEIASFGLSNYVTVEDGYDCKHATFPANDGEGDEDFVCAGGMEINVYGENVWSWHDDFMGKTVFSGALATELTYIFECDADLTKCQIYPSADLFGDLTGADAIVVPSDAVSFDITRVDDGQWNRNSIIAGQDDYPHVYYLKQVVTCDGKHGEHWDAWTSHGTAPSNNKVDIFGNGLDTRGTVAEVHDTHLLARKL